MTGFALNQFVRHHRLDALKLAKHFHLVILDLAALDSARLDEVRQRDFRPAEVGVGLAEGVMQLHALAVAERRIVARQFLHDRQLRIAGGKALGHG